MLADLKAQPNVTEVFDSSKIPGEIMDMMVVNTKTLQDNPALGKALTGAWFEMVALMHASSANSTAAMTAMAKASGTDLAGFKGQLSTTALFYTPKAALDFVDEPEPAAHHDARRQVLVRSRPARARRAERGRGRHGVRQRRRDRQQEQRQAALRSDLCRAWPPTASSDSKIHDPRGAAHDATHQPTSRAESGALMLLLMPFIVLVAVYFTGSSLRLKDNPDDKVLPSADANERRDPPVRLHRGQAHRRVSAVGRHRRRACGGSASDSW